MFISLRHLSEQLGKHSRRCCRTLCRDSLGGDTSDDGKMEIADGRSRAAVIYEQQSREGEIINERDMKQGHGRPHKQHLVLWEPSWVNGSRLHRSRLDRNWREKRASKGGH